MWRNNIVTRQLSTKAFGHDLDIYGIDQKGIHMNEAGSRNTRTLEIQGAPVVALKQNHAATRDRVSIMTTVTSNKAAATRPGGLPVEVLFRHKGKRKANFLEPLRAQLPPSANISIVTGPKGSYRQEHVYEFLERYLDVWTPERETAGDWRILYMDAYRSHLGAQMFDLCWSRGYVLLYHYGCTTGIAQVNDTDLHAELERIYVELETFGFQEKQAIDPSDISRTRQEVMDDIAETWRQCDHTQGVEGHKRTGLSVSLTGDEDPLIAREANMFWKDLGMGERRKEWICEVNEAFANGTLVWSKECVRALIHDPQDKGEFDEGHEFDGDRIEGEPCWEEAGAIQEARQAQEKIIEDMQSDDDDLALASVPHVQVEPGDDAVDVEEAEAELKRKSDLEHLRRVSARIRMPLTVWHCDQKIRQIEKTAALPPMQKKENAVLKREVKRAMDRKDKQTLARRKKALKLKRAKQKVMAIAAKVRLRVAKAAERRKLAKATVAEQARVLETKLAAIPNTYTPEDVGHTHKTGMLEKHINNRLGCLNRLHLRAPPLSTAYEKEWPSLRDWFAVEYLKRFKENGGMHFIRIVKEVIEKLGTHLSGGTSPVKGKGDPDAFKSFVKRLWNDRGLVIDKIVL